MSSTKGENGTYKQEGKVMLAYSTVLAFPYYNFKCNIEA